MSIRRYLVLTLFSMLTLITFIAAIQGYKESMAKAEQQFDQQLVDLAHTLLAVNSVLITEQHQPPQNTIQVVQQGSFAFQVWKNKRLLVKSNNAPDHQINNNTQATTNKSVNHADLNFFEVNFLNERWRSLIISPTSNQNDNQGVSVVVAQPLKAQFALAQALILAAVTPMIIAIAFLSVFIFVIITQGLKPLHQLSTELSRRKSDDFSPLTLQVPNTELADIVETLNQLFTRLDTAFQRERHFASDAAHELKTPLSVLKIDTHNLIHDLSKRLAIKADNSVAISEVRQFSSIEALTNSVDRMGHVIDQILNLNRTNSAQILSVSHIFNFKLLLQQVIGELYHDISLKNQTIALDSEDVLLSGHEFSIHLLVVNLISNANKYTPVGGEINVSVTHTVNQQIMLCIEDSGVGIAQDEHQRVFDRFYRVGGDQHDSSVLGCGLGLAIVKHIADLHGADITLSPSPTLKGLKVTVIFGNKIQTEGQVDG